MKKNKKLIGIFLITLLCLPIISWSILSGDFLKVNKCKAIILLSTSEAYINETISFNGKKSFGDIVEWIWDFNDGFTSNNSKEAHIYNFSAYFNVSLVVKDKDGNTDKAVETLTIQNKDFHRETSGTNLVHIAMWGDYWDIIYFPILHGITKPTLYANWNGQANLADIVVAIGVRDGPRYYVEEKYIINDQFDINVIIEPSEIEEFGEHDILIAVREGNLENYFMEVDIIY